MAFQVQVVAVAATGTLIWQTSTGVSPDTAIAPASGVYRAGANGTPRPIFVNVPSGSTLLPVSTVGGSPAAGVAGWVGPVSLPFNVIGNSQFIGAITGTGNVTVVADY